MGIQGKREKQAEIAMLNPSELYDYRESQKDYWDMYAVTETAEKKGRAEGLAEGMAKGMAKGVLQTAKNMKLMGLNSNIISQATGLSESEIEKL